jgi:hypothetical protein
MYLKVPRSVDLCSTTLESVAGVPAGRGCHSAGAESGATKPMQQEYEANGCMGKPTAGVAGQFEEDELMLRPRERKPLTVEVEIDGGDHTDRTVEWTMRPLPKTLAGEYRDSTETL